MTETRLLVLQNPHSTENPTENGSSLWSIREAPLRLHVQGKRRGFDLLERLPDAGLGIVGTREPQARALSLVRKTIRELRKTKLVILSGLARGVDAAAHEAALEEGLPTIAILGGGLNRIYPRENQRLAEKIVASGGLLISEFPDDMPPQPGFFIRRNRLIAGWSLAVWVVEAGARSGALNTANWARENGREVYASPCFPEDPAFAGNQRLIDQDHARPLWAAHNFGATWLELAAMAPLSTALNPELPGMNGVDAKSEIFEQIRRVSKTKGGATADELLQWALERKWSVQEFFLALQDAVHTQKITERRGSFTLAD